CSGHVLHLVVQEGYKINSNFSDQPLNKLCQCISTIHRSPKLIQELQKLCEHSEEKFHKPAIDIITCWTSTYHMVDIALGQCKALDMLIANAEHGSILKENSFTDKDWEEISRDYNQLKMFFKASEILIAENYPTLNLVHSIYVRLINKLNAQSTDQSKNMAEKLHNYWMKLPIESSLATILDPHIKINSNLYQKNIRKTDIVKNQKAYFNLLKKHAKIYTESIPRQVEILLSKKTAFEEFLDLTEELKSTSELVDAINVDQEIKLYFDTPIADQRVKPLDWWKSHEKEFPTLAAMARDWLAITASSVPCESLFSIAGNTITANRNRLHPETARALLCLKSWWNFDKNLNN
ncbi:ribonuclease H-like domain-containing protein, partial [Jimgerdemannia flammicorona]